MPNVSLINTKFDLGSDIQGRNAYVLIPSVNMYTATLAESTAESITVPSSSGRWIAYFRYQSGVNFYVSTTNTATVPSGSSFEFSNSELNPPSYQLIAGTTISVITANSDGGDVSIALYSYT